MPIRHLLFALLYLLFLPVHAQQALRFQVLTGWEYLLKTPPGSDSLIRSADPTLSPWMPPGQQGWQLCNQAEASFYFQPATPALSDTLFARWLVLAWVRHDPWIWDTELVSATFDPLHARIDLEIVLHPVGSRRKQPLTSTAILLLQQTTAIQQTGPGNLRFRIHERAAAADSDCPLQDFDSGDLIFAPAWSSEELRQCWESYQAFLKTEAGSTETGQP